jgi:hypothetical protein
MLLVKFDENWADEMDVSGFKLFKSEQDWQKAIKEFKDEHGIEDEENCCFEVYFGTNEENQYTSFSRFLRRFEVTNISDAEAVVLLTLFPDLVQFEYGHFPI